MPVFLDNLSRALRNARVFDPNAPQNQSAMNIVTETPQDEDMAPYNFDARLAQLYHPEHDALDRFEASIGQMPERANFKPSLGRRITAGLMAGKDPALGNAYLEGPYSSAMGEWSARMDPMYKAAQLEHTGNQNMRAVANSIISQEMSERRLQETMNRNRTLERQGDARIGQAEDRANLAERKFAEMQREFEERNKIAKAVANGGVPMIDDAGVARMQFKDGSSIEINGDYLSYEQKQDIMRRRQIAVAKASPSARNRVKEGYMPDPANPGQFIKSVIDLDTGTETPVTTAPPKQPNKPLANKPQGELEKSRAINTRAQQIKSSNAKWSKYIKMKNGRFEEITRPGVFSGPTQEMYNEIYQAIYGSAPPAGGAPQTQAGKKRVIGPSGETGTVPDTTTELPKGWRFQ